MAGPRTYVDPLIGKTIGGRYRLIQRIGSGGMSTVYLARHVLIDRLMAIKTLRRDLAEDPVQRDRFIREARAVNRINHENIVEITDFGDGEDGLVYLVMEYVPGEPLLKLMSQGPFSVARAFHIAEQASSALGRAHQMGVVHRDLKPENILVVQRPDRRDFVKILDFGIAKILDAPSLTASQQIFGTPGYIAPEYIQSTQIDGRADLYSLGVILYEMVTGALPFDYEYPGDLLVKHVTEPPIAPSARRADIPVVVEDFLLRCLAKDPAQRFRDAFHFLDELRMVRGRLSGELRLSAPMLGLPDQSDPDDLPTPRVSSVPKRPDFAKTQPDAFVPSDPRGTAEYPRPSFPAPPDEDLPIDVDVDLADLPPEQKPTPAEQARSAEGLLGVKRWRRRFEALRAALDEIEGRGPSPGEIEHAMAFASRALEELEESTPVAENHQAAVETLAEKARDFRATLGKTIDQVAGELSKRRGELELVVDRRNALAVQREAARAGVREAVVREGQADAILWELAAVEQDVASKAAQCDELESQLGELRAKLERENEQFEIGIAALVQVLDGEMQRLERMAGSLREPLDRVEEYVRAIWAL